MRSADVEAHRISMNKKRPAANAKKQGDVMNRKQKLVLFIGIVIMIIMGIIPPWSAENQITYRFAKQVVGDDLKPDDPSYYPKYGEVTKYRFLFRPPWPILYDEPDPVTGKASDSFKVNFGVLCIQWVAVGLITGYIIIESKDRKKGR